MVLALLSQDFCCGTVFKLSQSSVLKRASGLALGIAFLPLAVFASVPDATGRDVVAPKYGLNGFVNNFAPEGWQPQPFYMWTQSAAPAAGAQGPMQAVSAPGAASTAALAPVPASPSASTSTSASGAPTPPAPPPGPVSVRSPKPQLPDGDSFKDTILGEYSLTGFFRKSFKRGQRFIYIDVYDFQTADGAYGAYNYLRRGSTTVLPRGDAASEDDSSISVVQGKTFISIYGTSQDDDETKELLTKLVGQALKSMGEKGTASNVLSRLPQLDLVHGSEKIVMGPATVRRFFPAPYLNSLGLDSASIVGCVGDYQLQEPVKERLKLMVLSFRTIREAQSSYQHFLTDLGTAHDEDTSAMLNQVINVFKTGRTYLGIQLKGADLLMVTGARKRFSPAIVLRQVR